MSRRAAVGCAPALLGALDFGLLALAAPALATDVGVGATTYGWLFTAGALAYGAVVLPSTALLRHVAPSRLLAAGLTIAALGVTTLALAEGPAAALVARVLFGAGGGMAAGPALILLGEEEAGGRDGAFARMGGAIAIGFSSGVLLGASSAWRASLVAVLALLAAMIAVTLSLPAERRRAPGAATGAVRLGAATAATGAFLAALPAEPLLAGAALAAAIALGRSGWAAVRAGLPASRGAMAVACAAGAATTMSGVGATVLLGQHLGGSGSLADGLTLAAFGVGTLPGVMAARALGLRVGATGTAVFGLLLQAVALLLVAPTLGAAPALAPAVALFGAGHVVANAGSAAAVMQAAGDAAAGLFVTCQYVAAGAGPLVVLGVAGERGQAAGMILAAAVALGAAAVASGAQRLAPTHSASRSA